MTERRDPARPDAGAPDPVLGEGMSFDGLLVLPRAARIDGRVGGEVLAHAEVEVGATGVVEADLEANEIVVNGHVAGDVSARRSIALGPGAVVEGDLAAPRLSMAEGARVNGRCHCGDPSEGGAEHPDSDPSAS